MPRVSDFIVVAGSRRYSFKTFQGLSDLVREALVWATKEQIAGNACDERDVVTRMIQRFHVNLTGTIGGYTLEMDKFIADVVHCRMVRCYVDHGCNMMAAKLAWRDDY